MSKLPLELINIILENLGGIYHRDKMSIMKKELEKEGIIKLCNRTPGFYFTEYWGVSEASRIIIYFQDCKCCDKHKNNKPTIKDLENGFVPYYPINPKKKLQDGTCVCPCRHLCRSLCREINDEETE